MSGNYLKKWSEYIMTIVYVLVYIFWDSFDVLGVFEDYNEALKHDDEHTIIVPVEKNKYYEHGAIP